MTAQEQEPTKQMRHPWERISNRFSQIKQSILERSRPHKNLHYWVKKAFDELLAIRLIRFVVQLIAFVLLNFFAIIYVLGYNPLLYSPLAGVGWLIPVFGFIPLPYVIPHGNPAGTGIGVLDTIMLIGSQGMFPFIALGIVLIVPSLIGRSFCGWICPFGFVQDLCSLTPIRTRWPSHSVNETLSPIKYVALGLTFLITLWVGIWTFLGIEQDLVTTLGPFAISFWSVLSPAGTLFVIIPYLVLNGHISPFIQNWGNMLTWPPLIWVRIIFLAIVILLALFIRRPYCRWICPVGAMMGLVSQFSLLGITRRSVECPGGACESQRCQKECPMGIQVMEAPWGRLYDRNCILCLDCIAKCHDKAIKVEFP